MDRTLTGLAAATALAGFLLTFVPVAWGVGVPVALVGLAIAGPAWDRTRADRVAHTLAWVAIGAGLAALVLHLLVYVEIVSLRRLGG